ncbi:hypothetical protein CASFOL_032297 [Castilleja foliolosa]|uniref:VAN3-binding protein-like auxin canalisation domain-containing protein n=1 Tax=Castilleja foliolosa TaxID=1961234 RepID=A0ABD3C137_9LAMI
MIGSTPPLKLCKIEAAGDIQLLIAVAGVASAIAAIAAATAVASSKGKDEQIMKTDMTVASDATLVAAQCVEAAESMGADRDHLMSAISSADNIRSHGHISTPPQACGRANKYKILPSDARKRPVAAIDFSGRRVTVRDVASKNNFKSNQTQKALANEVWNGDFHKNLVLNIKTQSLFEKDGSVLFVAGFVLAVVGSIDCCEGGCNTFRGHHLGFIGSPRSKTKMDNIQISSKDLCCARIIDWIFSYVFGDGDPNQGIEEEKRWKMKLLHILTLRLLGR